MHTISAQESPMEDEHARLTPDTPAGAGLVWTPGPELQSDRTLHGYYTGRCEDDDLCTHIFEIQPETWPEGSTLWVDASETTLTGQDHDVPTPDPVHAVLDSGWTLTAPEGTDPSVLDFVVRELEDNDVLWSVEDATRHLTVPTTPEPETTPSMFRELLHRTVMDKLERDLQAQAVFDSFIFGERKAGPGPVVYDTVKQEPWWYTSNPGSDSDAAQQVKRRFIDAQQPYHWRADDIAAGAIFGWDPAAPAGDSYGHIAVMGDHGVLRHYIAPDPELDALTAKWAAHPPARPGWTGSIAGPPRPIPLKLTPWQALPKAMHDGNRTIIIEPGADSNPDARLMKLEYGRWKDAGPAYPDGLGPAYRGKPAPIPWDSPLADPLADLRAAGGGTVYGEYRTPEAQ